MLTASLLGTVTLVPVLVAFPTAAELNIPIAFAIAFIIEKSLSEEEKQAIYDSAE